MTQYGPEFFRKFADIITEAEQASAPVNTPAMKALQQKIAAALLNAAQSGTISESDELNESSLKQKILSAGLAALLTVGAVGGASAGDISQDAYHPGQPQATNPIHFNDAWSGIANRITHLKGAQYSRTDAMSDALKLTIAMSQDNIKNAKTGEDEWNNPAMATAGEPYNDPNNIQHGLQSWAKSMGSPIANTGRDAKKYRGNIGKGPWQRP